ncbi:MAG: UvrD-helicase domain-containing protein [Spirochaetia bacterium]|nr:UvrD-helicase domain-containing protein [Spirochaetia bacterium]
MKFENSLGLLEGLNDVQKTAVLHEEGPLLIFAGAGSGKTRVITYRIAHLCRHKNVAPWQILAVTFTNKAAGEMRERLSGILGKKSDDIFVRTFHSLGLYILSRHCEQAGLKSGFSIYDDAAQKSLVKAILKEKKIDPEYISHDAVIQFANRMRDRFDSGAYSSSGHYDKELLGLTDEYFKKLKENNAVDYAGLLYESVKLLNGYPDILALYRNLWKYFLIDEYQDTNHTQYVMGKLLAGENNNLVVVGDDDQSIYSWRGADISNILNFETDYTDCRVLRLEENYRSTAPILKAASSLIANNQKRSKKELFTSKHEGEPVHYRLCGGDLDEVKTIVEKIQSLNSSGISSEDIAVLYRTNAQSRIFEQLFQERGIPCMIIGGFRFYERAEIKDLLAYLYVTVNPSDTVSLERIINVPARGVGEAAIGKLRKLSQERGITLFEAMPFAPEIKGVRSASKIAHLYAMFREASESVFSGTFPSEIAAGILKKSGYLDSLKKNKNPESISRKDNLDEFINAMKEYEEQTLARGDSPDLPGYLQSISLFTDEMKSQEGGPAVSLMTLHNAKGLEYKVVFIAGIEEGYLPHKISMDEGMLEEERRLLYVGITRAKEKLYLSSSRYRRIFGSIQPRMASRFISEIDPDVIEKKEEETSLPYRPDAGRAVHNFNESQRESAIAYKTGERVIHERYGHGTVVTAENTVSGQKITIEFDEDGRSRKFLTAYTPLKKENSA